MEEVKKCKCGKLAVMRKRKDGKTSSMGACHDCLSTRMKAGRGKRKLKGLNHKIPTSKIKVDYSVSVDFYNHKDVYNKLLEKSKIEIRTLEAQIIYMLRMV